ncbi:MAG: hypothetical protein ACP5N7_07280 [Candidatus Pacearchaeota archaeon]
MRKEKWYFENNWFAFWFGWRFEFSFAICGYFDNRPQIIISPVFCTLIIKLPFKNKWENECDCPKWGIAYHNQTFWFYLGGKGNNNGGSKWKTIDMPWRYEWVRTSALRKDNSWEHETKGNNKSFYKDEWNGILWSETYPYTYILKSGEIQNRQATVKVEEREWRMKFLKWVSLFNKTRKTIDVQFNDEVGEKTGSWKGGVTGCGYELLENENPLDCLRRMEKKRKF